jgi:hypothetical protein
MSGDDRYPELIEYKKAKRAIEDFDMSNVRTAEAIKTLAKMLERGGWSAVTFDVEVESVPEPQRIQEDITPVSLGALRSIGSLPGTALIEIVRERRLLVQHCRAVYAAIPQELKEFASSAPEATPPIRPRRG